LIDEVGDAVGDGARLSCAGARENQDGAFSGDDGFALAGVEAGEKFFG
jgi:hypothetical protein